MNNPDTPRTEAARFEALRSSALRTDCIPLKLGQELERELNASKAEVERLLGVLRFLRDECDIGKRTFRRVSEAINQSTI